MVLALLSFSKKFILFPRAITQTPFHVFLSINTKNWLQFIKLVSWVPHLASVISHPESLTNVSTDKQQRNNRNRIITNRKGKCLIFASQCISELLNLFLSLNVLLQGKPLLYFFVFLNDSLGVFPSLELRLFPAAVQVAGKTRRRRFIPLLPAPRPPIHPPLLQTFREIPP